jgi:hypothetical protein
MMYLSDASNKVIAFAKKTTSHVSAYYYKAVENIHEAGLRYVRNATNLVIDRYANLAYTVLIVAIVMLNLSITALIQRLVLYYRYPVMIVSDATLVCVVYLMHRYSVGKTLFIDWLKDMADKQIARLDGALVSKYGLVAPVAEPEPEPEVAAEPEPVADPVSEDEPEPVADPVSEDNFELVADPVPEDDFELVAAPVPVVADPVPEDDFELVAAPVPVVAPVPEDDFELVAAPVVADPVPEDDFELVA